MDRLQAMETFVRVIESGSFKKAAETTRVLPSTVTRTIKELESHLDTRLLNRTTRALSLTDAGLRYYDSCKAILREVRVAEETAAQQAGMLQGRIRISAPPSFSKNFLIPELPRFTERYPGIDLDFDLSDAAVDIVRRGIDCAIRAGELQPTRLIARRLGAFRWYVCGSPDYFKRYGEPRSVESLGEHCSVGYVDSRTGRSTSWIFRQGDGIAAIPRRQHISVNDTEAYVAAAVAGLGLIRVASYMVRQQLADGRLIKVQSDFDAPLEPISILYPQSRHLSPAVRAFIDWCIDVIGRKAKDW